MCALRSAATSSSLSRSRCSWVGTSEVNQVAARRGASRPRAHRLVPGDQRAADHLHARRRTTAAAPAPSARPRRAGARWRRPRRARRRARAAPASGAPVEPGRLDDQARRRPDRRASRGGRRPRRSPTPRASPSSPGRTLASGRGCLNLRSWQPPLSGSPARGPAPCPPRVAPVLAGTGVAAYVDEAVLVEGAARAGRQPGAAGGGQLRQRLLRRHPRHRRRPGRPDAAGRLRRRRAGRGEAGGVPGLRRRRRRPGWCSRPTTAWWLVAVGRGLRAGRVVLHRRLASPTATSASAR